MSKIGIQFFATPYEIVSFINQCTREFPIHAVAISFQNEFSAKLIEEIDIDFINMNEISDIYFSLDKPVIGDKTGRTFLSNNPGSLVIEIGIHKEESLKESCISAISDNSEELKCWRKIIKLLKKNTNKGGWVTNPHSKSKGFYKSIRYTKGKK